MNQTGFDKHFEESLITAMVTDDQFAQQMMDVIELKYFELSYTTKIAQLLVQHYKNYETFPSVNLLESIITKEEKDESLRRQCVGFIAQIKKKVDFNDLEYVKDKSLQFFRVKNLYRVLDDEILPLLERAETENGNFLEQISSIVQKAAVKGSEKNIGYSYLDDEVERFSEENYGKVPTPWEFMNKILKGGWGNGRLISAIGPAGAGKSHYCVNAGIGALTSVKENGEGHTVVHYTAELSDFEVAIRYDAGITGTEIDDVPSSKERVLDHLKTKLPAGAKLIIKSYPMRTASVQTIKNHLSQLKVQGIIPNLIIIDYGDLLKSSTEDKERRHNLESIWIEMKSLAQQMNVPIFTVTQTNRGAYNSDIVTPDQVSEDYSKIMHSDVIFTIARNMEQKQSGIGKIYIAKNRQGKDGQIMAYRIDTGKCAITIEEMTEEILQEMEEANMNTEAKKQQGIAEGLKRMIGKKAE